MRRANEAINRRLQQAVKLHRDGKRQSAEAIYRELLRDNPDHVDLLQLLGTVCAQDKRYDDALDLLQRATQIDPHAAVVVHNLANVLQEMGRYDEAVEQYRLVLDRSPQYRDAWTGLGNAYKELQRIADALECFDRAIAIEDTAQARQSQGNMLRRLGRHEEALAAFDRALALQPGVPGTLYNRANTLLSLERYDEALAGFEASLRIKPDQPEALNNLGNVLQALKRHEDGLAAYERALAVRPDYVDAWLNRGNALNAMRRYADALQCYERALELDPESADAPNGKGVVLTSLQRTGDALESFNQALARRPDHAEALNNMGDALVAARRFTEAAGAFDKAAGGAKAKYVAGGAYDCRQHCCDWSRYAADTTRLAQGVQAGKLVVAPFVFVAMSQDAQAQLDCARLFGADRYPAHRDALWKGERYSHERIRVAYLSADFHSHATAFLMAELFELHRRDHFEWIAYSFGPIRTGAMRERLEAAFDEFHEVGGRSDLEIARMLREREIDIAIDLKGYTQYCRPGVFARRPAPVQVSYLGYPGTMGVPYMDYIIGDTIVTPPQHDAAYAEKVVRLPGSYQCNDRQREVAPQCPTREELGLPAEGFVFCCFNNNYKITPAVFDVWMRLLRQVPGSVLWLLADNAEVPANLRKEAQARQVDPVRLVFAPRAELSDHLARHAQADLFLDTSPYNAHTTASDALWAGLPVLTCLGTAFAARVAASLLHATALPELVTDSMEAYEARALHLATHPKELRALRERLQRDRLAVPLFDTARFRDRIEAAFLLMHERAQQGLQPAAIEADAIEARARARPADKAQPRPTRRAAAPAAAVGTVGAGGAAEAFRAGTALLRRHDPAGALRLLDQAALERPKHAPTQINRVAALLALNRVNEALVAAERAVELDPEGADGLNNLGSVNMKLQRPAAALEAYDKALARNPGSADVHTNRAVALEALNRFAEAAVAYATSRRIDPDRRTIHSSEAFALRKGCLWPDPADPSTDVPDAAAVMRACVERGQVVSPFVVLGVCDDPQLQLRAAKAYGLARYAAKPPIWQGERYAHEKIRIAYLSADFHDHATAYLMAELFEAHTRERFEWWGISFGPSRPGAMRKRLEEAFDHFIDVSERTDADVAQQMRQLEIDIAIDLKGYTQDCRPLILGHRPVPVQVSYLGYPGTMAVPYIDYIVGDATVIPPGDERYYTEAVVRLPDSYQCNDRRRAIAAHVPSRAELGLPEAGFVFCCFNNPYKISPGVFDVWMRLLAQVPGSVLWLLATNDEVPGNLRKEAQRRGIDGARLVFAPRAQLPEHLARHAHADLFLDTLPYNAHTTTSDALWAGLPVLTCMGQAFPGRVAASLLRAVGLPELVTDSIDAYESKALHLATHPADLRAVRDKLKRQRDTSALFDTERFRDHMEAAYLHMHERSRQGLPPETFDVAGRQGLRANAPAAVEAPAAPRRPSKQLTEYLTRGRAAHAAGLLNEASQAYDAALALEPRNADALQLRGVVCAQQGAYRDAERLMRDALSITGPNAPWLCNLANALQQLGRLEESLATYDQALALQPGFRDAIANRAVAQRRMDEQTSVG